MSGGVETQCTIDDPVSCAWQSGRAPSLFVAVQRLIKHRNAAHSWGDPWIFSYTDPVTGETREAS